MKGILLLGGSGTRLKPLTNVTNKHLLPIGEKPMLHYPLEVLLNAGIDDILVVTGTEHSGDIFRYLGSGKNFECKFTFKVQDEAGGIAQAIALGKEFIGKEQFIVILGDNIMLNEENEPNMGNLISPLIPSNKCKVYLKEVADPERFGVARFEGNTLVEVLEKPVNPPSNKALMGIYQFTSEIFDVIEKIKPSERGELEITDAIDQFLNDDPTKVEWCLYEGFWSDAGKHESYQGVNMLMFDNIHKSK